MSPISFDPRANENRAARVARFNQVLAGNVQTLDVAPILNAGKLHSARVADVRAIMARPAGFALFAR